MFNFLVSFSIFLKLLNTMFGTEKYFLREMGGDLEKLTKSGTTIGTAVPPLQFLSSKI